MCALNQKGFRHCIGSSCDKVYFIVSYHSPFVTHLFVYIMSTTLELLIKFGNKGQHFKVHSKRRD